jgi:hypothetical protein
VLHGRICQVVSFYLAIFQSVLDFTATDLAAEFANKGMDDLGQAMDEIEIKSLLIRERYYRDTCQWEKLRGCYHPDASKTSIDISWWVQMLQSRAAKFYPITGTEQFLHDLGLRATLTVLCQALKPCGFGMDLADKDFDLTTTTTMAGSSSFKISITC